MKQYLKKILMVIVFTIPSFAVFNLLHNLCSIKQAVFHECKCGNERKTDLRPMFQVHCWKDIQLFDVDFKLFSVEIILSLELEGANWFWLDYEFTFSDHHVGLAMVGSKLTGFIWWSLVLSITPPSRLMNRAAVIYVAISIFILQIKNKDLSLKLSHWAILVFVIWNRFSPFLWYFEHFNGWSEDAPTF